ncbi:MAG: DUF4097 family beta strand repeat-containing protein [Clostridia bacterium]
MNASLIIKIVCWSIVALVLIGVLISGLFGFSIGRLWPSRFSPSPDNDYEYSGPDASGAYSVPAAGINDISIGWINGNVTITAYDGDDITFAETSPNQALDPKFKLHYRISGSKLIIEYWDEDAKLIRLPNKLTKNLELNIPASIAKSLVSLEVEGISAHVTASAISCTEIDLSTISGTIELTIVSANELSVSSTSGELNIAECTCDKLDAESISGHINFAGTANMINSETVSGRADYMLSSCPASISADTVSGSVNIGIPENDGFKARIDKVSGHLSTDFPVTMEDDYTVYKNGTSSFKISTVSGNVSINKII